MERLNKRSLGTQKEIIAAKYLSERGFFVKERNFRTRQGEIDLIGYDGDYLVFVEVKYRSTLDFADPLAAVNLRKQQKISKVAQYYRCIHKVNLSKPIRYDVVGILQNDVIWLKNAFPHRNC